MEEHPNNTLPYLALFQNNSKAHCHHVGCSRYMKKNKNAME
jgi:hypothetical protein